MEKAFESLKQLLQQEFAKMVADISKQYGLEHIEIAEDIVSDTFLTASETCGMKGIPPNPAAWLYSVAKQKTLYHVSRHKIYEQKVIPGIKAQQPTDHEPDTMNFSQ